jgi:hypothetical protein
MVDDEALYESYNPGPYPGPLSTTCLQQQTPNLQQPFILQSQGSQMHGNSLGSSVSLPLELYDLMPDADPFGLSASMQLPMPFSHDTSSMR